MNYFEQLNNKIESKQAKIGIIGMGYVGLPLALEFAESDFNVTGFDIDKNKIPFLNEGKSYIKHIGSERIKNVVEKNKFIATNNFKELENQDILIICVPTPLNKYREPDLSYIENTAKTISENFRIGQLVILESSTYPRTTEEIIKPLLDNPLNEKLRGQSLEVGKDYFLAYSPEREDPNNPNFKTKDIPKVVGGTTKNCLQLAKKLYDQVIVKTVPVSSTKVAEATKLLENIYRSVNIALVNELKIVFSKMGIDIWEVIEAAKTKPFGFQAFYPGPGLGGHCIPIDPFYLTWKARE
jgi:UDP-N-acetyl-D-glucosamine dehydrogenase